MILVDWGSKCPCCSSGERVGVAIVDGAHVTVILNMLGGSVTTSGLPTGDVTDMPAAEFIALTNVCLG